jgi:hypothetical protein
VILLTVRRQSRPRRLRAALEALQALDDVLRPAVALAVFAITDDVDTAVGLMLHDIGNGALERCVQLRAGDGLAGVQRLENRQQFRRTDQAANVGGENPVLRAHRCSSIARPTPGPALPQGPECAPDQRTRL